MAKNRSAVLICKCGATTHAGHQAQLDWGYPRHTYAGAAAPDGDLS